LREADERGVMFGGVVTEKENAREAGTPLAETAGGEVCCVVVGGGWMPPLMMR
jgi:hypothetical protein